MLNTINQYYEWLKESEIKYHFPELLCFDLIFLFIELLDQFVTFRDAFICVSIN
ncbi:hypothetical protein HNQ88_003884 [Aureibacter tunicatorum]|uniref:Uncharacterized protein n=1 Tax=Aureibacter tunicatorum TaxID=866807 RepID=A0AAE4BUI9_9BACT|nr:hypothetical protein [Aureibacter tunicatorum]BDD06859.1 hypothetical protein AUTU_43420 [Aureibacter tunicatorum]